MKFTKCPPFLIQLILRTLPRIFISNARPEPAVREQQDQCFSLRQEETQVSTAPMRQHLHESGHSLFRSAQAGRDWWQGRALLTACWSSDKARCQVQSKVNLGIQSTSQDYLHHASPRDIGQRIHQCGTQLMLVRAVEFNGKTWNRKVHKDLCKVLHLVANQTFILLWAWSVVNPHFWHHIYQSNLDIGNSI